LYAPVATDIIGPAFSAEADTPAAVFPDRLIRSDFAGYDVIKWILKGAPVWCVVAVHGLDEERVAAI